MKWFKKNNRKTTVTLIRKTMFDGEVQYVVEVDGVFADFTNDPNKAIQLYDKILGTHKKAGEEIMLETTIE